ncbi:MAG: site-2 protease family protein [Candidatus Aenigmarchaeota archaeon]|nr:site-2 protease family protein [Candidatus Aenigmarchaeota archaeon]
MDVGTASFVIFIAFMLAVLYLKRKEIEFQGVLALYKTTKLRSSIYKIGKDHKTFWKAYFSLGILVGVLIMILGLAYISGTTIDLISGKSTPAFGLVIPYPTSEISYESGLLKVPAWLWVLAIPFLLIPHELSHGLALAANKLKIKSLGLISLLIIPGAFVEPDEEELKKAGKKEKLQVYCAGSFSNLVVGLVLVLFTHMLLAGFYAPAGITYSLPWTMLNTSEVVSNQTLENGLVELRTQNEIYLLTPALLSAQENETLIAAYEDLPAARNNLSGVIKSIGGFETNNPEEVRQALSTFSPGETVEIVTSSGTYTPTLADRNGTAYLGIQFNKPNTMVALIAPQNVRPYEAKSEVAKPVLDFLLSLTNFIIAVCIGVAIFNMLPMKPLDGGLVLEAITNSSIAKASTLLVLGLLLINFGAAIFA